jgi:two-component system chemotaxis response regulator CheB
MKNIQSGEIGFSVTGEIFQTVLGSCVSVCIYDPDLKIGGMNHFLLPDRSSANIKLELTKNALNFGDDSIAALLKNFKKAGSNPGRLKVYLCGGSSANSTSLLNVGKENIKKARELLAQYNLHIHKESTGPSGMNVKFDTSSGDIYVSATGPSELIPNTVSARPSQAKIATSELIKVLIVDDSEPIRKILRLCLTKNSRIHIVGEAADPFEAEILRNKFRPDVMTLDVNMPKKNGVTYLGELMATSPMPVIMVTDLNLKEASPIMKALELGAFDYIQKPSAFEIEKFGEKLNAVVSAAYGFKSKVIRVKPSLAGCNYDKSIELIAIGSSTGGIEALRSIFRELPSSTPPIVLVQHIPASFSGAFAESLNRLSKIEVKEAKDGDIITHNTAYIAPGGTQMKLKSHKGKIVICITDDPEMNRFKPSVDYLFNSIASLAIAGKTKAAILTGMGDDGARGMLALRNAGASTIAQNEESCVVYGMPKVAVEMKAVQKILDLSEIGYHLLKKVA